MVLSNQPYQRVDDGIGSGLVGGSVVGGAIAGATHRWGAQGISKLGAVNKDLAFSRAMKFGGGDEAKVARMSTDHERVKIGLDKASDWHKKGFGGSGKAKAVAYAGSVLAGGVIGAGADALNK